MASLSAAQVPAGREWPRGSLLAAFSPVACAEVLALGTRRRFTAGEHLLTQGERSAHVYLLLDGVAKVTVETEAGPSLVAVRVAGDAVGELAGLDGEPRIATVVAAGQLDACRVGAAQFGRFLEAHPDAARALSSSVAKKLRWATRRRGDLRPYPVRARLARLLLELAAQHGHPVADGVDVGIALSQAELAALIGCAELSVHRALRELRERDALRTGYRHLLLAEPAVLRAAAGLDPVDDVTG